MAQIRIWSFISASAAGCFIAALGSVISPCLASPTATFHGDAQHRGVYTGAGPTDHLTVKWQFATRGRVISSPALADGKVYVGSTDGNLYAVDAGTGEQKWKFKTGARIVSSPAVADGLVVIGSYDGAYYAVDARTGQQRWKFNTEGERRFEAKHLHGALPAAELMPDPFDFYMSSPAIVGGTVYFGSGDGNVYALDVAGGTLKWKFHTGDVVHASPAVAQGTVYIGSWDTYFYALDAQTGKEKWRFKTGEDANIHNQTGIQSSPAVADGMVYFGCRDSFLYALDAKTGEKKWAFDNKKSWVIGTPAIYDGKVLFATSDTGKFREVDALTGQEIFSLDFKGWPMFSSPAVAGGRAYIGSHNGRLYAIDLKSQRIAAQFETEASKANGPGITNPDGTPNYAAVISENFYDAWVVAQSRLMSNGAILSSPAIASGVLFVGSMDGNLYALR